MPEPQSTSSPPPVPWDANHVVTVTDEANVALQSPPLEEAPAEGTVHRLDVDDTVKITVK